MQTKAEHTHAASREYPEAAANGDSYAGVDDTFASITASTPIDYYEQPSAYLMVNTNKVAVGMETNATYDQPHGYEANWNSRWKRQVIEQNGIKTLIAQNGQWTYRSEAATDAIGDEERPYTTLVFTGDANSRAVLIGKMPQLPMRISLLRSLAQPTIISGLSPHIPLRFRFRRNASLPPDRR